jgi:DNA-binding phage protein
MGQNFPELRRKIAEKWDSMTAFAVGAKVSRSQVYRLLDGEGGMSFSTACRMADALGISVDELRELLGVEAVSPKAAA